MKKIFVMAFVLCASLSVVGCARESYVRYPNAERVKEDIHQSTSSLYEENKEWAKEKAEQIVNTAVDYAAVGAVKAGEAYDAAAEKARELKERFKNQVKDYQENK